MEISKTAVGVLAGLCIAAGAGGAYFATRSGEAVQTGEVKPRAIIILPKRAPRKTDDEETVRKVVAVAK